MTSTTYCKENTRKKLAKHTRMQLEAVEKRVDTVSRHWWMPLSQMATVLSIFLTRQNPSVLFCMRQWSFKKFSFFYSLISPGWTLATLSIYQNSFVEPDIFLRRNWDFYKDELTHNVNWFFWHRLVCFCGLYKISDQSLEDLTSQKAEMTLCVTVDVQVGRGLELTNTRVPTHPIYSVNKRRTLGCHFAVILYTAATIWQRRVTRSLINESLKRESSKGSRPAYNVPIEPTQGTTASSKWFESRPSALPSWL